MRAFLILLRNSALSFSHNLVTKAANVVVFILIARLGGADAAGIFSLATTYLLIFSALTWGLDELLVRQIARNPAASGQYLGAFLGVRVVLTIGLYAAMYALVGPILSYQAGTAIPILVMGLSLFPDNISLVAQAFLAGHERFDTPALAAFLANLVKIAWAVVALSSGVDLVIISWGWVIGGTLSAAIVLSSAWRLAGPPRSFKLLDRPFWAEQFQMGLPFLVIGFLLTLEYQTDVIILSAVRNEAEVGWYSAATTIAFSLMLIPSAFRAAVYPLMARYRQNEPGKLNRLYDLSFTYLAVAALPLAVGLYLLAPRIVALLYTDGFTGTVLPLQIIAWSLIFNFLNVPSSRMMLVHDRQVWLSLFLLASMGLNVILNLALDPEYGVAGAAVARLCSTIAFFLPNYLFVTRFIQSHNLSRALVRPLLAAGVMGLAVWWWRAAPLIGLVAGGGALYFAVLLAIRGLPDPRQARIGFSP